MPSWAVERSTALLGYAKGTVTMKTLSFDIETYSDQPLAKTGVYRYCLLYPAAAQTVGGRSTAGQYLHRR